MKEYLAEIKSEDWATLMDRIEKEIGGDERKLIEHRVKVLEDMLLRYQLEAEEDEW